MGHDIGVMRDVYTHISEERESQTKKKIKTLYDARKPDLQSEAVVKSGCRKDEK